MEWIPLVEYVEKAVNARRESYITKSRTLGCEKFPQGVPSILELQDMIERAWDMGFNSTGRTETGGIKGTRKFIGTPEVSNWVN